MELPRERRDAVVVGAGPNGLTAAIRLAQAGRRVTLIEGNERIGGGLRSLEATTPGFVHDVCAAVHPLAAASPYLSRLPLAAHGLRWIEPDMLLAHPFDDGSAVTLDRSLAATAAGLGVDGPAYGRLIAPLATGAPTLLPALLGPIRPRSLAPPMLRFAAVGLQPAAALARLTFRTPEARALFAGLAAHSVLPLEAPLSAAYGLVLAMLAHVVGWPVAANGSQAIAEALASLFRTLGGQIVVGHPVATLGDLPDADLLLFDVAPVHLAAIAAERLPASFRRSLARHRYGAAAFKVDWALSDAVPWTAAACRRAGTLHLGGTLEEIAESERSVDLGLCPERPFVLAAQPSLFDPSRAPAGGQTLWAYCHVPLGSTIDVTDRIEAQIERFAPGFRDRILARRVWPPCDLERWDANDVGGAIDGGRRDLRAVIAESLSPGSPYATPDPGIFLASASTPPGGGAHGMCGFHAAEAALHAARSRRRMRDTLRGRRW
jgi:phytoene dehydrogenase-like protein